MPDRPDRDPDDESTAPSPDPASEDRTDLDYDAEFSRLVADWGPTPDLDDKPAAEPAPRSDESLERLLRQAWPEEPARAAPEDEGHYEPPPPPPIPRPEPRRMLAWLGLFGAPIVGLVLLVSPLPLPSYVGYALFATFVWGFGYLVWTMGSPRDGWDDGARL